VALKVMTFVGTRPELIRLSSTIRRLDQVFEHSLVHTGQNYDDQLNATFFRDFGLRAPDRALGVDTSTIGAMLGSILTKAELALKEVRPDAVLVLGDTNSALASIVARRLKIPVFHMEAGNRSFDPNVPEEVNRKIVDHVADFNLVYTEHARRNLIAEGLPARRIYLTGSPMREVLDDNKSRIDESGIVDALDLKRGRYFVASIHREETVDRFESLRSILDCLVSLCERHGMPAVVSTHPRTRNRMEQAGIDQASFNGLIFSEPMGFLDYVRLQRDSFCVISDSGTISEESAILGFPAVTVRSAMERPEALDAGVVILTGLDASTVVSAVDLVTSRRGKQPSVPTEYLIDNTSERVTRLIVGLTGLSGRWHGLHHLDIER
jgi:UDP-N-acetylglucosamine 2-epimerase